MGPLQQVVLNHGATNPQLLLFNVAKWRGWIPWSSTASPE